jgi:hypothetical protein
MGSALSILSQIYLYSSYFVDWLAYLLGYLISSLLM